jgi:hypothetical protein
MPLSARRARLQVSFIQYELIVLSEAFIMSIVSSGSPRMALARMRWPSGIRWPLDAGAHQSWDGSGVPGPRL